MHNINIISVEKLPNSSGPGYDIVTYKLIRNDNGKPFKISCNFWYAANNFKCSMIMDELISLNEALYSSYGQITNINEAYEMICRSENIMK